MCANYYLQSFLLVLNFRLNVDSKTFLNVILSDLCKRSLSLKIHNVRT